ncbi:PP2C family protein-serine/threonine phosphatase [Micromonosporaceae bacterium DT55]|uniref:PP2C family protein-serine/threonine phosphatase n=1 Tax=Melissospora conviva TaxID=3388432 RepID=UPI003C139450
MDERTSRVCDTLTAAPVDLLVERLEEELRRSYGITGAELLQVDYRLSTLLPLRGGEPVSSAGHPAWHCFDHQSPALADGVGYFPVTVRGERTGVLRVTPVPSEPELLGELVEVARLLAHELAAAGTGTDRYTVAARSRRLTLAAEMQWELLPGRSRVRPSFSLAGQLEPAYAVRGDNFDWSDNGERLWLSVLNGMGEGTAASALTTLAVNALRNARRAGVDLADQAELADQALYSFHRGEQHVSVLLLGVELRTGRVTAVDAGSPRLLLLRDGEVTHQKLEAQLPLGMFDGTRYEAQHFDLRVGDRLFVVSDGVTEATAAAGRYGDAALARFLRRTAAMAPMQAVRSILGDLRAFVGTDLVDDAVVVCLDWSGPQP